MGIIGHKPGYMIGAFEPQHTRRSKGEFKTCPGCGGRMHHSAQLCHECRAKNNGTYDPIEREDAADRRARFDAALAAGWTLEELYSYDGEYTPGMDKLPTWEQIAARDIGVVIVSYCRGMGE